MSNMVPEFLLRKLLLFWAITFDYDWEFKSLVRKSLMLLFFLAFKEKCFSYSRTCTACSESFKKYFA